MAITSSGVGSGLDISGIISQLMTVEQQPLTVLNTKEFGLQSKLSALGTLKGALSQFQTSVKTLTNPKQFDQISSSVSDSTIATVSTTSGAQLGSFSLEVSQLATGHKVNSGVFSKTSDAVGTGKLSIQLGAYTEGVFSANPDQSVMSVTIDSTNNSLAGVRDAINQASGKVTASIVNDGTGNRLVLSSKDTGTANSIKITVEDDDSTNTDASGLSQLAFDSGSAIGAGQNMSELQTAKNALMKIDGLTVSKSSNTVSDAVEGVTLTLSKITTTPVTVSVARSSSTVSAAIQSFVKSYNDLSSTLTELGHYSYDSSTKQKDVGALQGERSLRSVQTQLRNVLGGVLEGGGSYARLSDVGITFNKDGTLALDSSKLDTAIKDNYSSVATLFAANASPTDSKVSYVSATDFTKAGTYAINVTQLATKGAIAGSALTLPYTNIAASNASLGISLGASTSSINLTSGSYSTTAALAAELKSKIESNATLFTAGDVIAVAYNTTTQKFDISRTRGVDTDTMSLAFSPKPFIVDANNKTLKVKLDGTQSDTITLSEGIYSGEGLAAELQSRINGDSLLKAASVTGEVAWDSDTSSFTFKSSQYGSSSTIEITSLGANTASLLGVSVGLGVDGLDVVATVGGGSATGDGQELTVSEGDATGLKLQIDGTTSGDRGSITFNRGFAYQLDALLEGMLSSTGVIASRVDGLNASIKTINTSRETISRRLVDTETRYRKQFTALDILLANMKQTSSYLTSQLASLASLSS